MARSILIDVLQCRGGPYEVGYQLAEQLIKVRGDSARRSRGALRPSKGRFADACRTLQALAPNIMAELEGIADGLDLPLDKTVAAFSNGRLPYPRHGCSAIMSRGLYGRNYDFSPRRYDRALVAIQVDGAYASIGFSDRYTGRLDGMNEQGLCVGLHYVNEEVWQPGLGSILIVRLLLDQCASTAEAIDLLHRLPHGLGFNYSIMDLKGEAAVVEASPDGIAVRRSPWLACTNHFQSEELRPANREAIQHSVRRLPPLEHWAEAGLDAASLFRAFNDARSPAFHYGYKAGFGTLHTLVCEPTKGELTIGVGASAKPLCVDLRAWVRGGEILVDQLKGTLGVRDSKAFFGRDLAKAEFRNVNLVSAVFDNINFAEAEITANCNFQGMRIADVPIEELFAAYREAKQRGKGKKRTKRRRKTS